MTPPEPNHPPVPDADSFNRAMVSGLLRIAVNEQQRPVDHLINRLAQPDAGPWFDDALHFTNWIFLVLALVLLVAPAVLERWTLILLGSGMGALAIVLWEALEWVIQDMGTTGLQLTYDDTVGDLVLSTSGGVLGAVVTAALLNRRN